ncbi:MAG: hypothetical protein QOH88_3140 [Verrucomicrobiota bacterium]|jgi:hypothetical protein
MKRNVEFWASLIGAVIFAFVIARWVPGDPKEKIVLAIEYGGLVITFLFGFMILAAIASGKIDISAILEEKSADGTSAGASMSRFQLLIFTFVIALSLFLIVVNTGDFPTSIPPEVLTLLGISAATYAVSKGIQAGSTNGDANSSTTDSTTTKGPATTTTTTRTTPTTGIPPVH